MEGRAKVPIMDYFDYEHMTPDMQAVCGPIGDAARLLDERLERSAEKTIVLRKLLEARDSAIRAAQV